MQQQRNRLRKEGAHLSRDERNRLMAETYKDRRHHVLNLDTSVWRILHMYPAMKDPEEVLCMFVYFVGESRWSVLT